MSDEKKSWNQKYRAGSHTSVEPDPFLLRAHGKFVEPLLETPGRVLDVAGGVGRHAIFYAKLGWRATLVDISEEGAALAEANAAKSHVKIKTLVADLNYVDWHTWKEQ